MESAYTKLALYGSQNECVTTDNIFFPITEFCDGTVSLTTHNHISELYKVTTNYQNVKR